MQVHRTCPYINAGLEKPAPRDAPSPYVKPQMMWRVQDDYAGRCSISRQSAKGSKQKIGVADCQLLTLRRVSLKIQVAYGREISRNSTAHLRPVGKRSVGAG